MKLWTGSFFLAENIWCRCADRSRPALLSVLRLPAHAAGAEAKVRRNSPKRSSRRCISPWFTR